ncbi:MAG: DUF507 family protein [Myxococcales bacterium]|nr:DUF507 family protein [Myxococcales bacterium]
MKLYAGKVDTIAAEVINKLTGDGDLEVSDPHEAQLDVASVLKEYLRVDRELTERAKDILEIRGLPHGHLFRTKKQLADQKDFGLGEEALTWITNQMVETFMQSKNVDEVYAEDVTLRKKIKEIVRKHMAVEDELDQEVRNRLKNIQEGSSAWDLEYARVLDQVKQKHGLKE